MKLKLFSLTAGMLLLLTTCSQDHNYMSQGTITGQDIRACVCCGGWFISIGETIYEFQTLPSGSGINLETETFPFNVRLDWKFPSGNSCYNRYIDILRISK